MAVSRTTQPAAFPIGLTPEQRRQGVVFLCLTTACVSFALALQLAMNANFLADEIGVGGVDLGQLEAVRESCGILAFGFLALLAGLSEPAVGTLMILLFAAGLGGYAGARTYWSVMAFSVVWSQGLHVWMPLPNSMAMGLAEKGREGRALGWVMAAGSVGFGAGLLYGLAMTSLKIGMRPLLVVAAVTAVVGAVFCQGIPRAIRTPGPQVVFRTRYWLYYLLSFLEGWRKQISMCFAGFLLVRDHHTPVWTMFLLWSIIQTVSCISSPFVGSLIDRIGERTILIFYYTSLTVLFIGYAAMANVIVLYAIFVVDSAFFVFHMALSTYANRLVPAAERTPTLSMGVAMSHASAVAMPLAGGWLWDHADHKWVFLAGAVGAVLSAMVSALVPPRCAAPGETA